MKFKFDVWFSLRFRFYSAVTFVAETEAEAKRLAEEHLADRKPLGFSEREIRKRSPKRTPWVEGLEIMMVHRMGPVRDDDETEIPF